MDLSLPMELDFRHEAENAMRTKEYFKQHSDAPLVIPQGKSSVSLLNAFQVSDTL